MSTALRPLQDVRPTAEPQLWSCYTDPQGGIKQGLSTEEIGTALASGARTLREVFAVKRLVLNLRRHLAPERDALSVLTNRPSTLMTPDTQIYFRDIYDHVLRIYDSLENFRDLLSSTLDSYLTQVSNRLGMATKALGVVATFTLPFVVISGIWGMNFEHIPLHSNPHGFTVLVSAQVMVALLILAGLKWRKLL